MCYADVIAETNIQGLQTTASIRSQRMEDTVRVGGGRYLSIACISGGVSTIAVALINNESK
jgi:hypothetical protein